MRVVDEWTDELRLFRVTLPDDAERISLDDIHDHNCAIAVKMLFRLREHERKSPAVPALSIEYDGDNMSQDYVAVTALWRAGLILLTWVHRRDTGEIVGVLAQRDKLRFK